MSAKNPSPYTMSVIDIQRICQLIGCTGIDPDMCRERPFNCGIIRKIFRERMGNESETTKQEQETKIDHLA